MKFKATIRKISSNAYGVTIPKAFIDSNILREGQEINLEVLEK